MNKETSLPQKPTFIHERGTAHIVRLGFIGGTQFEDFETRLFQLFEYAIAKKQKEENRSVQVCFDSCFEGKWDLICEALAKFIDRLSNINVLDFQHSDLRFKTLFQLYLLYSKQDNMENLLKICVFDTYAHDGHKDILKIFEVVEKGKEFLKRVYFPENKYLPEKWNA